MAETLTRRGTSNKNERGSSYTRRNNIRPACGQCNSETGGALASKGRKK